ncbi:MAG: chemotaxis protein CheD [Bacteriovoracaceae bacterium]|nr:chemotaxis protein CheD [Bacteriovoracaceae bacterium]
MRNWNVEKFLFLNAEREINKRIVDISDMIISTDVNDVLVTYSLGSCLGIIVHDQVLGIGGMIHAMLPSSKTDRQKAELKPAMFVDTGLQLLLSRMLSLGSYKKNLIIKVAGGASPLDKNSVFKIGERNLAILRKILWKNNLMLSGEDVGGGHNPRTMYFSMHSGITLVKSAENIWEL